MEISIETIMAAVEEDDYIGFCTACGANAVYGAEELLITGGTI